MKAWRYILCVAVLIAGQTSAKCQTDVDWSNLGSAQYAKGQYDGALKSFAAAIRLNPKEAALFNNRGLAKYALQNYTGAVADFTKAISINPKHPGFFSNRGGAQMLLGNYRSAIRDFDAAIALKPDDTTAAENRRRAYASEAEVDRAINARIEQQAQSEIQQAAASAQARSRPRSRPTVICNTDYMGGAVMPSMPGMIAPIIVPSASSTTTCR